MISIDLPADLHFEDDQGNNLARLSDAVAPERVSKGAVLVAGTEYAWTWAEVLEVDPDGWVHYQQITTAEAASKATLVVPLPRSA